MADVQRTDAEPDSWYSALTGSIYVLRVPLAMAVFTVIALTVPEQVQEVYRVLAQGRAEALWNPQLLIALGALIALSIVLWQVAREHSYGRTGLNRRGGPADAHPAEVEHLPIPQSFNGLLERRFARELKAEQNCERVQHVFL